MGERIRQEHRIFVSFVLPSYNLSMLFKSTVSPSNHAEQCTGYGYARVTLKELPDLKDKQDALESKNQATGNKRKAQDRNIS
ncbi:MAG TPA: hypothetical protein V6C97_28755 [Oculatellaceae cyanobacterium]